MPLRGFKGQGNPNHQFRNSGISQMDSTIRMFLKVNFMLKDSHNNNKEKLEYHKLVFTVHFEYITEFISHFK